MQPQRDESELDADRQPGSRETPRHGLDPTVAPHPAPAVTRAAGQGQAATQANDAGAEGPAERTNSATTRASDQSCGPTESGPQSRGGDLNNTEKAGKTAENPPSGPVLERTLLPAGSAGDVAFAVKCSDAAPVTRASNSMPAGIPSGETIDPQVVVGVLQSGNVAESATPPSRPQAGSPTLPEAAIAVAIAGHGDSAGTDNPPPGNGSAEQRECPGPAIPQSKLTHSAPKAEATSNANGMSGKQSSLKASSGAGSVGSEMGKTSVAAPLPSEAGRAASDGPSSVPAHRGAPESRAVQPPAMVLEPSAAQSAGRIDLRVHGEKNEIVDIRLVARGNEVQVTVKTASPGLTSELRGGLQDLVQTLRDSSLQTEAWRPLAASSSSSRADNNTGAEQKPTPEGGQGGRESASGWKQEDRGGRGRQDSAPRWVEELEASSAGPPATNWRELSWQQ
jgi:hypothetical protein